MRLATGNWKLRTGVSRRGIALIITLTIMALLLILATAFVVNMRSERLVSYNYRRGVEARQAALAGLHTGIAKMNRFFTDAEAVNGSVATMAGRFYYTNGTANALITLNGSTHTAYTTNNMLMFSGIQGPLMAASGATNWMNKVNLNAGNFLWSATPAQQSSYYLPIANPSQAKGNWGDPAKVEVFAGFMVLNSTALNGTPQAAFWIDDESSKINISNAGQANLTGLGTNNTVTFFDTGHPAPGAPFPYAAIVQQNGRQLSTVDLTMLDTKVVSPGSVSSIETRNWNATTVTSIDQARNDGGAWRAFIGPDEVLGLNNNLTQQDYQAVKSCLTAWSVEKEDLSQMFKLGNSAVARTNIGVTITDPASALRLYNFLAGSSNLLASASVGNFFHGANFPAKYSGGTNGSVQQIAANIISYISDPTRVAPQGSQPPNAVNVQVGSSYDPKNSTLIPTGPCGLWKAAYMNEIAVSLIWQPITQIPPSVPPVTQYQLWADLYVELINPYEIPLPKSGQQYQIFFDPVGAFGGTKIHVQYTVVVMQGSPAVPTPKTVTLDVPLPGTNIVVDTTATIPAHAYTQPVRVIGGSASQGGVGTHFQWMVGGPTLGSTQFPVINNAVATIGQVRQAMTGSGAKGIIDWFPGTNISLSIAAGKLRASPAVTPPVLPPDPVDPCAYFWQADNRWSVAKNDPRVHSWLGVYSGAQVTIKPYSSATGRNAVDYAGGDSETTGAFAMNASFPEWRSNFVMAEGGMKSIGELGFIHTGKPWRSLSLQAYGSQMDEDSQGMGHTVKAIPDWAILDLFAVNSPPIYGRININNGGWHLGNVASGTTGTMPVTYPTFEQENHYPSHPNLVAAWSGGNGPYAWSSWFTVANYQWCYMSMRTSAYNPFGVTTVVSSTNSPAAYFGDACSVPLAAALNVIPNPNFRNKLANYIYYRYHPINDKRTTFAPQGDPSDKSFDPVGNIWQPYYTVGQICELPCMNYHIAGDGTTGGGGVVATTDADKEDIIRRIINVLTVRGDVFTVHAVGQADSGEARLVAVVERIHNPTAQLVNRNQFRILQVRWLSD